MSSIPNPPHGRTTKTPQPDLASRAASPDAAPALRSALGKRIAALLAHRHAKHTTLLEPRSVAPRSIAPDAVTGFLDDDADLNRIQLTGSLGSEPLLYDVGDHPVAQLALACARRWRAADGSVQLETTWFNLMATDELANQCGQLLHRGDRVYVEEYLYHSTDTLAPRSYVCSTVVLDRIVLLATGSGSLCNGDHS